MKGTADGLDDLSDDDGDGSLLADINVTPLVDVMLVLLIVFMVAAPLMVHGVPVDLPKAGGASLGRPAKPLIVSLTRSGDIYLRDEKIAVTELVAHLQAIRSNEGDALVYVRADRSIAYGTVMEVIAGFGASGFTHVSLLNQPTVEGAKP